MNHEISDGISQLPDCPGIYCILNRKSGARGVGLAQTSVKKRAYAHKMLMERGGGQNALVKRAVRTDGYEAFIFLLLEAVDAEQTASRTALAAREGWWAHQLHALDERYGYNLEAGGVRSLASRFRDTESKLMRSNSCSYELLPQTSFHAPINQDLLAAWAADAVDPMPA